MSDLPELPPLPDYYDFVEGLERGRTYEYARIVQIATWNDAIEAVLRLFNSDIGTWHRLEEALRGLKR